VCAVTTLSVLACGGDVQTLERPGGSRVSAAEQAAAEREAEVRSLAEMLEAEQADVSADDEDSDMATGRIFSDAASADFERLAASLPGDEGLAVALVGGEGAVEQLTVADRRKPKPKRPVSQAQARLYGLVARRGAGSARKLARGEMSRPEAKSTLRGVPVSALPERKLSTKPKPKPKPKPAAKPKPSAAPKRTAAQRAATAKRNARKRAGY